jgi:hypothetical protein
MRGQLWTNGVFMNETDKIVIQDGSYNTHLRRSIHKATPFDSLKIIIPADDIYSKHGCSYKVHYLISRCNYVTYTNRFTVPLL